MIFRLAFLLFVFLCHNLSHAQSQHYNVVNYNTDNGLPQNSISGIEIDRKGYCWLGTQMGLVRFDGQRFSLFGSGNIKGLKSERIFNVTKDNTGNIFVATGTPVTTLKIDDAHPVAASLPVVLQSPRINIPFKGMANSIAFGDLLTPHSTFQVDLGTVKGNMYLIQRDKSYYITPRSKVPILFKGAYEVRRILLIDESLVALRSHNKALVWTEGVEQPEPELSGSLWTNPDFIKGDFTAPSNADGAYIYAGNTLYQLSLIHNKLHSEVVLENIVIPNVSSFYFDKQNNRYYIGSAVSGLYVITPADFFGPPAPATAINQGFYSQSVTKEGILSQQFLFRRDGTYKEYPLTPNLKSTWYRPETRSLYYAPDLALLRFDLGSGRTYCLTTFATQLSSVFPNPWQEDNLVFSTSFTIGKIAHDTLLDEKRMPLTKGQELFAPYPAGTDTFLLATWSGVKWYDYRRNSIYKSILDSLVIRQLYIESPRRIWIASYGKGWYLYDKGHITKMPDGPLDALRTVNAIIDDGRGYFWLSSNNGLYKVNKQALLNYAQNKSEEVYFYAFATKDHLPTNEFNSCNPSYVWLPDSMLSLPSLKGLVWFYPHKIKPSLPDKGIYIEHIRVNQTDIAQRGGKLVLDADHGRLNIKVSSPYFGNKENMQLRFRIEGLDEEWNTVPENGEIIIERIPAGSYSLVVRKVTGLAPGQHIHIILSIQVHPHWYNTRLFYVLLLLSIIALLFWLTRLRTQLLQARNRKLKTQVAMQTRNLNRMVFQLTQSEEALRESNQTKDNIITTVLHDLRSPIRFIYTISKHIAIGHRKMQQDTLDLHLKELKNSTASLNSFTDQFFTWALSQHRSFSAKYTRESLAGLFQETEMLYADIMSANGNKLIVSPTGLYCYTDPQLLSTVVRNLLDNANKYTRNGIITLSAEQTEKETVITVSDTGSGFSPDALNAFLSKEKTDPRSGRGSFIMLYLLELMGGYLEAGSEPGIGTTFRVILRHHDVAPGNTPAG